MSQVNAETSQSNPGQKNQEQVKSTDFIRTIINEHLKTGEYAGRVVTRFPPEPNGYLHIGHAKSICLNFGIANDYPGGVCHLRMDDTDPTKEDMDYVESIQRDVQWLGFQWKSPMFYASDYFEPLYQYALALIENGKAYVCSLNEQEIREYRGNLTEPGKDSPYRSRSVAENLDLFKRMRGGEFPDGAHVLRAKIDMANPNIKMRDPLLYRIRHAHHYRAGDQWPIYPLYDFAHCLSDSLERITHSICTLEFENNRELYDWILEAVGVETPRPHQYEFARLNLNYTVMSKRKLLQLVEENHVSGWDDPRLPTISGLRRRGYTPEAIRNFCKAIGIAKSNSMVDMSQLEFSIRDDLNQKVPRVLGVLRPLKVVIENYPEGKSEELDAPYYPHDVPKEGSRQLPFSREIYIEQDDFMENPPKNYYRLSPGSEVRLRHAYIIKCERVIKDAQGNIIELRCAYDPATKSGADTGETRQVKGTIHWVSIAHAVPAEIRLYDRLYNTEQPEDSTELNPNSLQVLAECYVESSLASAEPGSRYQFERQGYFCADAVDSKPGKLVFNRIVTLKDTWAKQAKASIPVEVKITAKGTVVKQPVAKPKQEAPVLTLAQTQRLESYCKQYKLAEDEARLLAQDDDLAAFFEQSVVAHNNPEAIANWIVNELLHGLKDKSLAQLPFDAAAFAELIALIDAETISGKIAKDVLARMLKGEGTPKAIVESQGLKQLSNADELLPIIERIIAANPENVALYRAGKNNVFGFFVGQVMKETGGQANPKLVNDLIKQKLD